MFLPSKNWLDLFAKNRVSPGERTSLENRLTPWKAQGDGFDSKNINLLSHLYLNEIGNLGASNVMGDDIWGWTDATSGREFALMGLTNRTSFIEVTDPTAPVYLGSWKTTAGTGKKAWRDVKVYNEQAYIVSDNNGADGLQVFDLTQLLTASSSST
ncbi:MAG: choice-of-anchor B family protein [Pirellulales bacterium]